MENGPPPNGSRWSARCWGLMAVLDIQITNASLKRYFRARSVGSLDEGSWISTAYLWRNCRDRRHGVARPCLSIGTIFSFSRVAFVFFFDLLRLSQNLNMMIVGRALQGLTGGALIRWR